MFCISPHFVFKWIKAKKLENIFSSSEKCLERDRQWGGWIWRMRVRGFVKSCEKFELPFWWILISIFPFQQNSSVNWGLCLTHAWIEEKGCDLEVLLYVFECVRFWKCVFLRVFRNLDVDGRPLYQNVGQFWTNMNCICVRIAHS